MGTLRKRSVPYDVLNSSSDDEESLSDSSSGDSDSDFSDSDLEERRQEMTLTEISFWRLLRNIGNRVRWERRRRNRRGHGLWRDYREEPNFVVRIDFVNIPSRPPYPLPNPSGGDVDVVNGPDTDRDSRSSPRESNIRSSSRESFDHYSISSSSSFSRSRSRSRSRSFSPHRSRSRSSDLSAAESDDSDIQIIEGPIRDTGRESETDRQISATFPHQGDKDDRHEDERDHINVVRRENQGSSNRREEDYSSGDAQVYRQAQSQQTPSNRQTNHTGKVTIDVENSTTRALGECGNGEGSSSSAENCQSRSPLKRTRTESAGDTWDYTYSDNKRRKREPAKSPHNATSCSSPTNSLHQNIFDTCITELQPRSQRSNYTPSSVNSQWTFQPIDLPEHSAMDIENYHLDSDHFVNTPPRSPSPLSNLSGSDVNVVNGPDTDRDSTDWIYEKYYRRLYQSSRSFSRDHSRSTLRE